MRQFSTILFFLLLIICSSCSVTYGDTLYPACGGDERQGTANAGEEATIYAIPETSQNITLSCLAYEIKSLTGGMAYGRDPCRVFHQTEYLYRLVLRATYVDDQTEPSASVEYDLKDAVGGSLSGVAIRLSKKARFSLVLINKGTNKKCSLNARAIMDYTLSAKPTNNGHVPVVVGIMPRTVYTNRSASTSFVLRYPNEKSVEESKKDTFFFTKLNTECTYGTGFHLRLPSRFPPLDSFENTKTLSIRDYFFDKPEAYRLCYKGVQDNEGSELAIIGVFDGNPSYYQIISGQDQRGHVTAGELTEIKFYGYDLDTRPGGDRAKFVEEHESCATGLPAGGVPEATNLGPGDHYGPQTTYTTWKWTLQVGGAFKVCYRRRDGGWTEVPSIGESGTTPQSPGKPAGRVPQPTDPVTKEMCPMAPESTPERPWTSYKTIKMSMKEKILPDDFLKSLSKFFCIPRAALSVAHKSHNPKGELVVYLAIYCEDLEDTHTCDTTERQNYIIYVGSSNPGLLQGIGVLSVEGSKHMFARGDDAMIGRSSGHVLAVLMTCATMLAIVSITVYGVLKYREKREYFIQFGDGEGDVEDMYASGGPGDDFTGNGRRPVKNAVIEVED